MLQQPSLLLLRLNLVSGLGREIVLLIHLIQTIMEMILLPYE